MAFVNTGSVEGFSFVGAVKRTFENFGALIMNITESSSKAKAVNALSELTDAELEAKGTTRRKEIERILGVHMYL